MVTAPERSFRSTLQGFKSSIRPGNGSNATAPRPPPNETKDHFGDQHFELSSPALSTDTWYPEPPGRQLPTLESRKHLSIVLGLVLLDVVVSQIAIWEAIYDRASPSALDANLNITQTLHTSIHSFTFARVLLFSILLILRLVFLAETAYRMVALGPLPYLKSPLRAFDAVVVVLAFFLHLALPAREALLFNSIVFLRAWRVVPLIRRVETDASERHARAADDARRQRDTELVAVMDRNRTLKRQLTEQAQKLKVLTGDVSVMDHLEEDHHRPSATTPGSLPPINRFSTLERF
ncbi:hypothetical protein HKX48_000474 [Thoreauomyces humboldtii]|nr:hypothetical protein HKX48_000474 [Thoreauomyces humboldtii]